MLALRIAGISYFRKPPMGIDKRGVIRIRSQRPAGSGSWLGDGRETKTPATLSTIDCSHHLAQHSVCGRDEVRDSKQ